MRKKRSKIVNQAILATAGAGGLCQKVCKIALSATKRHQKPENKPTIRGKQVSWHFQAGKLQTSPHKAPPKKTH